MRRAFVWVTLVMLGCKGREPEAAPRVATVQSSPLSSTPSSPSPVTPAPPSPPPNTFADLPPPPGDAVAPSAPEAPAPPSTSEPAAASADLEPAADRGQPAPPPPGILASWRGGGECDPTGTWRVELSPQRHLCDPMPKETFDLTLGFVRKGGRTALAAVGRPVGKAGQVSGRMQSMQVSLLAGPYAGCEVRMHATLGRADWATETDLLFSVNGKKLQGLGVQWNAPHACPETFLLLGERSSPTPAAWARLGEPAPPLLPADPRPPSPALVDAVAGISAETVLGPAVATLSVPITDDIVDDQPVRTPLRGSIVEFVTALVGQKQDVSLHEVVCSLPDAGRCVAVVGDPCRLELLDPETDWDCEGMYLVVVVDVDRKRLDRADTGGFPVRSHLDVAEWERIAP